MGHSAIDCVLDHAERGLCEVLPDGRGDEILKSVNFLNHAAKARFNCWDRVACTDGTRVGVMQEIVTWIG